MTVALYLVLYVGAAVFVVASAARAVMYARQPLHLRWELYPVPHEAPERAEHGGSYFEETDWWQKPSAFNLAGELGVMVPEMLFLKALHEFNRKLWWRSFPFHFGLYLMIGACGLLLLSALLGIFVPSLAAGALGVALHWAYAAVGTAGVVLSLLGAIGLLHRRLTDKDLKNFTNPGDIFNLIFFLVTFLALGIGYVLRPEGAPGVSAVVRGLLTFDTTLGIPAAMAPGIVLGALLAAYIPLTHMSHFVAKYFTYHSIRWDDAATAKNRKVEVKLAEYLTYRPTWAAPHVTADGKRTWADVATTNPWEGGKK